MPKNLSDDEFMDAIRKYVSKYLDEPIKCFEKIMDLQYPNTTMNVPLEDARAYYEIYAKQLVEVKIDKDFDKNAYEKNKKVFENARVDYKPKK
jgi:hypothetical protein